MKLYRESIFCPVFRGDTPQQKRFFDAILSGCIPVVFSHHFLQNEQDEMYSTSYFSPHSGTTSRVYPWAKGSFGDKYPEMGIEYSKLVIEIEETALGETICDVKCMVKTLEILLTKDPAALKEKQNTIARYARLFSYGLQHNAFQYVDAMSALLVRARHYALYGA